MTLRGAFGMHLPDLSTLETIYEGRRTRVYRGASAEGQRVVVKALKEDFPTARSMRTLHHEDHVLRSVELPGVVRTFGVVAERDVTALLVEDFGGNSLADACHGRRLTTRTFLDVAIGAADALASLHDAGIVHKDISPGNILWNDKDGTVKLCDFGLSVVAQHDLAARQTGHSRDFVGTPAYVSPEQTGRTRRRIDWRSDLYSLGCSLYHALLGRPPFETQALAEVVHAHLALRPTPPHELDAGVPPALSDVLMRLLEKNAEDRYQSAHGLAADLRALRDAIDEGREPVLESLSTDTSTHRFRIPSRLYGREGELKRLRACVGAAGQGQPDVALVAGYPGIGKTALVEALRTDVLASGGTFIAGKFDQYARAIPLSALADAAERWVKHLMAQPTEVVAEYRARISAATAPATRVLVDAIPDLGLLLGDPPEVPELPAAEAEQRLLIALVRFLGALPEAGRPFVLFLDDLQWADLPSLQLVERLTTEGASGAFVLVGAYRDNEVDGAHPLRGIVDRLLRREGLHIELGPLTASDVDELVRDATHLTGSEAPSSVASEADELASICFEKTGGNPFFLGQFLRELPERGFLTFDHQVRAWRADLEAIRAQDFTDNVVDFMTQRVTECEGATRDALVVASMVGGSFELRRVAPLLPALQSPGATDDFDERAVWLALLPARAAGLIYLHDTEVPSGSFIHDRVQQATYALASPSQRARVHAAIGEASERRYHEGDESALLSAANHLAAARAIGASDAEVAATRARAEGEDALARARLYRDAAQTTRAASAYDDAQRFAIEGLAWMGRTPFVRDVALAIELTLEAARAAFLVGDDDAMEQHTAALLAQDLSPMDAARAYEIRVDSQNARNDLEGAIESSLAALSRLGLDLPASPSQGVVLAELAKTKFALRGRTLESLTTLSAAPRAEDAVIVELLMGLIGPAYYASPNLVPLLAFSSVRLALRRGVTPASATGFSVFALVLSTLSDFDGAYRYGQVAMAIADRFDDSRYATRARHLFNTHVRIWKEPWRASADALLGTHQRAYANGDFEYSAFSGFMRAALLGVTGRDLAETCEIMQRAAKALAAMKQDTSSLTLGIVRQAALNLTTVERGDHPPYALIGAAYDERQSVPQHHEANDHTNLYCYHATRLRLAIFFGENQAARDTAEQAIPFEAGASATFFVPDTHFYESIARIRCPARGPIEAARERVRLLMLRRKLVALSKAAPVNVAHRIAFLDAEQARSRGEAAAALEAYDRAAALAAENGYLDVAALAYECAASLQQKRGFGMMARTYLGAARSAYDAWGARAKVAEIDRAAPGLGRSASLGGGSASSTVGGTIGAAIDFDAATRASRAISREIVLDRLVERVLEVTVENAGAERGALITLTDDGPRLRAMLSYGGRKGIAAAGEGHDLRLFADQPLSESDELPTGIVRWVLETGRPVVLGDAAREGEFVREPYVQRRGAASILCAPIESKGGVRGAIYLENNVARGAFTPDRIELLQLLAAQAAVSIENAELYDGLEAKVRERTRQLQQRNEFIRKTFGRYLSDEVVDSILDSPDGLELGGELRDVTVLMADLRGFSTVASALPAETVLGLINRHLAAMTDVIFQYGGTIDEVLGDGLLVLFGAPVARGQDVDRAVACALAMQNAMAAVNEANAASGLPTMELGVGVHHGAAVVGNIGGDRRAKYGVVGAVVNLASRIEGLTIGGQVLVSEDVLEACDTSVERGRELVFEPKGAASPVTVVEVRGVGAPFHVQLEPVLAPLRAVAPFTVELARLSEVSVGDPEAATVTAVSPQALVLRRTAGELTARLAMLDNVRVVVDGVDARAYAKVVEVGESEVTLRWTTLPDLVQGALEERG